MQIVMTDVHESSPNGGKIRPYKTKMKCKATKLPSLEFDCKNQVKHCFQVSDK